MCPWAALAVRAEERACFSSAPVRPSLSVQHHCLSHLAAFSHRVEVECLCVFMVHHSITDITYNLAKYVRYVLATKTALLLSCSSPVLQGQRPLQVRQAWVQRTFSKSLHLKLSVLISKMGLLLVQTPRGVTEIVWLKLSVPVQSRSSPTKQGSHPR